MVVDQIKSKVGKGGKDVYKMVFMSRLTSEMTIAKEKTSEAVDLGLLDNTSGAVHLTVSDSCSGGDGSDSWSIAFDMQKSDN